MRRMLAAFCLLAASQARCWDQFGDLKFNSHTTITNDAALAANAELRQTRAETLKKWVSTLHRRKAPRLVPDHFRMDRRELKGGFLPEKHLDDGTMRSINRLQQGNTAADMPNRLHLALGSASPTSFLFDSYCGFYSRFSGAAIDGAACSGLPNASMGQSLHFLREYSETGGRVTLSSANDACRKSVELVRALTREAQGHWSKARSLKDPEEAMMEYELMYMFLGTAAHAIEDSFAPAHTQRSVEDPRIITDVCYYYDNSVLPPQQAHACAHAFGVGKEPRDSIHFQGNAQYPMGNSLWRTLATKAAQAYFSGFMNAAMDEVEGSGDFDRFLDEFLVSGRRDGMGYLDCSPLASR